MPYQWPAETNFTRVVLDVEERACRVCGGKLYVCDHREHRLFTLGGPVELVSRLVHCADLSCAGRSKTYSPEAETFITMPWWVLGWDVFCWLGQRRFARHWSVGQLVAELSESYQIEISADAVEKYIQRYQQMLAARQQDFARIEAAYRGVEDVVLSIDGLQPEKGHETLYVVRELNLKRVWFAEPLLSSAATEVHALIAQARQWAERLGKPVRGWITDKQDAFVTGVRKHFAGVAHRYCENHFLRDLAQPVLEKDSHAKVRMRRKVRGLRAIERTVLAEQDQPGEVAPQEGGDPEEEAAAVVLDYCAAVRGILNDNHGGPLQPPGLRMADALAEVQDSLQRAVGTKKGGSLKPSCAA